jgi:CubicO group peptidase (beta-lactamase class C family)
MDGRIQGTAIAAWAAAVVTPRGAALAAGGETGIGARQPATTRSLFHICSCSKAFTALAFAKLVEAGLTDWDAPMLPKVPEFQLADSWVSEHCTFRDLAGMRLGLTRDGIAEWGFRPDAPLVDRLGRAREMVFDAPFRDRFSYSNLGYVALVCAAERLAAATWGDLLQNLVFSPLKLRRASLAPADDLVWPHMPIGGRLTPVPELTGDSSWGSARVHLCAEDATLWLEAMLALQRDLAAMNDTGIFASQSLVRPRVVVPGLPTTWGYGFGWSLATHEGRQLFMHGGGGRGWRSMAILDPGSGAGVMVMLAHDGDEAEALAVELLDLAAGRFPERRTEAVAAKGALGAAGRGFARQTTAPEPQIAIGDLVGVYHGAVAGRAVVSRTEAGNLRLALDDAPALEADLRPLGGPMFQLEFTNLAMSRQPRDPGYRLRFKQNGLVRAEADYLGLLERTAP